MINFNRNKPVIISASVIIAGFILFSFLYRPLLKDLKLKGNEARTLETQAVKARDIVAFMKTAVNSSQQLVNEENLSLATDELIKRGASYHLNFVYTQPGQPVQESVYAVLPIDIVLDAGYSELGDFLGSLDTLTKSVVKVQAFDLAPSTSEPSKLRIKLTLNMYILK
jgi:Tfp pilus assembly protein PilO